MKDLVKNNNHVNILTFYFLNAILVILIEKLIIIGVHYEKQIFGWG